MKQIDSNPAKDMVLGVGTTKVFLKAMKVISERDGRHYSAAEYLNILLDDALRKMDPGYERWKKRRKNKKRAGAVGTEISLTFDDQKTRDEFEALLQK